MVSCPKYYKEGYKIVMRKIPSLENATTERTTLLNGLYTFRFS